jgi:hypothetical protein
MIMTQHAPSFGLVHYEPCCSRPPYIQPPLVSPKPGDSEISKIVKEFFAEKADLGATLHDRKCKTWYSNIVGEETIEKAMEIIETKKLTRIPLNFFRLRHSDRKYFQEQKNYQHKFWLDRQLNRGHLETVALYTLCVALPMVTLPRPLEKRMNIDLDSTEEDPPPKRQCVTVRKCGHCRETGHSVPKCTAVGIEEYRRKAKAASDRKKGLIPAIPVYTPTPPRPYESSRRPTITILPPEPLVGSHYTASRSQPNDGLSAHLARKVSSAVPAAHPKGVSPIAAARAIGRSLHATPQPRRPKLKKLPEGQCRFTIESLLYLMPLPLMKRLKGGGTLTPDELTAVFDKIPKKTPYDPNRVRVDSDLQITAMNLVYPNCPLGLTPLRWPVVGENCTHQLTQFFDLESLIKFWTDCGQSKDHVYDWNKCTYCKAEFRPATLQRDPRYEKKLADWKKPVVLPYKQDVVMLD